MILFHVFMFLSFTLFFVDRSKTNNTMRCLSGKRRPVGVGVGASARVRACVERVVSSSASSAAGCGGQYFVLRVVSFLLVVFCIFGFVVARNVYFACVSERRSSPWFDFVVLALKDWAARRVGVDTGSNGNRVMRVACSMCGSQTFPEAKLCV